MIQRRTRGHVNMSMCSGWSSVTAQRKCPHHGECDIDPERTGRASGTQWLTGRTDDDRAGSDSHGRERAPHKAHPGGILTESSGRTRSSLSIQRRTVITEVVHLDAPAIPAPTTPIWVSCSVSERA